RTPRRFVDCLPLALAFERRERIVARLQPFRLAAQLAPVFETFRIDDVAYRAARLGVVRTIGKTALPRGACNVVESGVDVARMPPGQEAAHARGIDDRGSARNRYQPAQRRRMTPAPVVAHRRRRHEVVARETIEQRRLSDARRAAERDRALCG